MTFPSDLRRAALRYAELGWPVFPLMPSGKTPVTKNGCLDASRFTPTVIDAWWHQNPTCNVGLATGTVFEVVDIDGDAGEAILEKTLGDYIHPGPEARTGRGRHLYFKSAGLYNTANPTLKIDYRGHNGYVVAPPSHHPNGHQYTWHTPPDTTLPELPDALRNVIGTNRFQEPSKHEMFVNFKASEGLDLRALLTTKYPGIRWHRVGNLYRATCPIGGHDKDPSFTVYPDQHYHCFGCGAHGWAHQIRKGGHSI